ALKNLNALGVEDAVELCESLLVKYAEDGDEIVFASGFPYVEKVESLNVVKERGLKVSFDKNDEIDGGFMLKGKNADKDLSYATLLADDRKENETEIARRIFNTD
ncbi:MAG: hypothetical protein LUD47_04610, partial [Clostridia bacterium]|nr:hypothetical protein [Clostridia bacterium]